MHNRLLINIFRTGFILILLLEVFSWKVLNASVTFTWQGLILTVLVFFAGLEFAFRYLHKKFGTQISWVSYAAGFTILSLDAAGDMLHLYTILSPWYDKAIHLIGGFAGAVIVYNILNIIHSARPAEFSKRWLVVLVIFITFFFGFAYEWMEYAEDVFYWHRQVRLGDAYDTIDDMQMNLVGTLVGALLMARLHRDPHKHPPLT